MFSQLNFSEIVTIIYHTPLVFIIFYYLIVFLITSTVKVIININLDALNTNLGIFKINEKVIPVLLLVAWFSLIVEFTTSLSNKIELLKSTPVLAFFCILLSLLLLFLIRGTQAFIQKNLWISTQKKKDKTFTPQRKRILRYVEYTDLSYKFVTLSILLTMFCLVFSYFKFGKWSLILISGLMFAYWGLVVIPKIKLIKKQLSYTHW